MNNLENHPLPPDDFNDKRLPTSEYSQPWYRLNPADFDSAIYFDRSGRGRFDSSQASYGILYTAQNERGAFIETMGRTLGITTVSQTALQQRNLFKITSDRPLVIVDVWGVNLTKLGVDARISSGSYHISRAWAEAIFNHPQRVDGICYHSRHDDTEICCGLFDRTANVLKEVNLGNLIEQNPKLLAGILRHYNYSLI
ncbi:MAG: RES family NAD+ phosphorylase [Pleurocapsa sp. SU_5_0]|nr:RES family NAD+ phosphorylase [Pleurocapsa sp. SU_5_0]NJO96996.1 RES family NAD+ phosphorylase [Pleurocapsa sp. CRU_1_2]